MRSASGVPYNSRNSHCIAYSHAEWDGLHDHLRVLSWKNIFKLGASAAAGEFCEWVQEGIDV